VIGSDERHAWCFIEEGSAPSRCRSDLCDNPPADGRVIRVDEFGPLDLHDVEVVFTPAADRTGACGRPTGRRPRS
jgi:hypothetical protein